MQLSGYIQAHPFSVLLFLHEFSCDPSLFGDIAVFAARAGGCLAPAAGCIVQLLAKGSSLVVPAGRWAPVSERLQPQEQRWVLGRQEGEARYHHVAMRGW